MKKNGQKVLKFKKKNCFFSFFFLLIFLNMVAYKTYRKFMIAGHFFHKKELLFLRRFSKKNQFSQLRGTKIRVKNFFFQFFFFLKKQLFLNTIIRKLGSLTHFFIFFKRKRKNAFFWKKNTKKYNVKSGPFFSFFNFGNLKFKSGWSNGIHSLCL